MPSAPPRGRNLPAPRNVPPVLDPTAAPVPETHQLPPHQSKMDRIGGHMAALSADLREYVEIRVALVQRKVEGVQQKIERVSLYADQAPLLAGAAILVVLGLLFVLVTLALGLGALVGRTWLGFLIVTLLLLITGGVMGWLGVRRIKAAQAIQAQLKDQHASRMREQVQHPSRTREQIQAAEAARQSVV